MKTVIRFLIAVMLLPRQIPLAVKFAQFVFQSMTNNHWFPNPVPTLAALLTAITELDQAQTATKSRAPGAVDIRNEKFRALKVLIKGLLAYVQGIANANPDKAEEIIHSAGFAVKRSTTHDRPEFEVKQGKLSGEVTLLVKRAAARAAYDWQYSADGKTWTTLPTTLQVKTTASGLTPGGTYLFRFRAVTRAGAGEWSQVVTFIVK